MIPVSQLMVAECPADRIVCLEPKRTWGDLRALSERIAGRLPVGESKPWLLAIDSTFQFAAALLACWRLGISVVISPDTRQGTMQQMLPFIGGIVTDGDGTPEKIATISLAQNGANVTSNFAISGNSVAIARSAAPEATAVELFTSGSTGERKRITKTFRQLDNEIAALQLQWGMETQGAPRFATVSHLHIYGFLFKVLWPLCSGAAFYETNFVFWEELLGQLAGDSAVIISSPAHLRHLPQAIRQVGGNVRHTTIFSSGGPLSKETSDAIEMAGASIPVEVFGSTETGGIAHRRQGSISAPWRPLPNVSIKIENELLAVQSPCLENPDAWFVTTDRVQAEEGNSFRLLGRNDRVVKVLEKRVSLDEMESRLTEHSFVSAGRILALPASEKSGRELLGAAMELTGEGKECFTREGRAGVIAELKRHLELHFESVTIPRRWRFVDALPRDAQGKTTLSGVLELFNSAQRREKPIVLHRETMVTGCLWRCKVPEDLVFLEGHFPQLPVVPGVCQLKWVLDGIEELTGKPAKVEALEAVKFHEILSPNQEFCMELAFNTAANKWNYKLFSGEKKLSSGRVQLAS